MRVDGRTETTDKMSLMVSAGSVRALSLFAAVAALCASCSKSVRPFSVAEIDRKIGPSSYPTASDPARVGSYPGKVKSGAGLFYDDVLEYRVWMHPERGAARLAGDYDYFAAFAQYEAASGFSKATAGAEAPLALVRQRESVNEPTPGKYEWVHEERITEWRVSWLKDSHRKPDSIRRFLEQHR